jgi:hypothetical protein
LDHNPGKWVTTVICAPPPSPEAFPEKHHLFSRRQKNVHSTILVWGIDPGRSLRRTINGGKNRIVRLRVLRFLIASTLRESRSTSKEGFNLAWGRDYIRRLCGSIVGFMRRLVEKKKVRPQSIRRFEALNFGALVLPCERRTHNGVRRRYAAKIEWPSARLAALR